MSNRADGTVIIDTKVDTSGMTTGLNKIEGGISKLGSGFKKLGGIIATVFAVKEIVSFSKECIQLGSDLEEVQNVVDVTFGKMSGAIEEFSKTAATQFGLSELSAKQYTSTLGAMYKSMGFTENAAADMSIEMTKLAADMASFYNLDTDEAFAKIRSGISGETEPLKQLGINLSEANLEEYRLAQGITTSYREMNQQDKALLRYNYLLSVTSDAQGDFARTSGSWANQTKILRLQFDSLKASLGQGFINLFTPVLQMINKVLEGMAKLASSFKAFTELITGNKATGGNTAASTGVDFAPDADTTQGFTDAAGSADDYADAVDDVTESTIAAQKANDKYLSGLDHVHKMQKNDTADISGGGGKSGSGGKVSLPSSIGGGTNPMSAIDYGSLAKGETEVDKFAKKMADMFKKIQEAAKPTADALKKLWNEGLAKLRSFTWDALKGFWNNFLVPLGKWTLGTGLPRFVNALNDGLMKVNWDKILTALNDFWKALEPFAETVGEGLLWFWENVLVPLGTWTMNEVVPRFLKTMTSVISLLNSILTALKPLWQWFWDNVLSPIAKFTGGVFLAVWDGINAVLKKFSDWCAKHPETIRTIAAVLSAFFAVMTFGIGGLVVAVAALSGKWDAIKAKTTEVWDTISSYLSEKWETIKTWAGEKFGVVKDKVVAAWNAIKTKTSEIWDKVSPYLSEKWETFKTWASEKFTSIKTSIGTAWDAVKTKTSTVWSSVSTTLTTKWATLKSNATTKFDGIGTKVKDTWDNIKTWTSEKWATISSSAVSIWGAMKSSVKNTFTGTNGISSIVSSAWGSVKTKMKTFTNWVSNTLSTKWDTSWGGIVDSFGTTFGGLIEYAKTPINAVISLINAMINAVNTALGHIEDAFTFDFSWDNPITGTHHDWKFWLDLPTISNIPELAQGAVIPPNSPFLATLGDQQRGMNIETPENLLRDIVRQESGGGTINLKVYLDRKVVYEAVVDEAKSRQRISGRNQLGFT